MQVLQVPGTPHCYVFLGSDWAAHARMFLRKPWLKLCENGHVTVGMILRHARPEKRAELVRNFEFWRGVYNQWIHIAYSLWEATSHMTFGLFQRGRSMIDTIRVDLVRALVECIEHGSTKPPGIDLVGLIATNALQLRQ
eukprot:6487081-Amphidinium_carterae.1